MNELILKFFIYSFAGWLLEGAWQITVCGKFRDKRMLVHLPLCPVYGFGGLAIGSLLGGFRGNYVLLYLIGAVLASAVELLYYAVNRIIFDIRVWDYSGLGANYEGGICALFSLLWGVPAVFVVSVAEPVLDSILFKMPADTKLIFSVFLSVIALADARNTIKYLLDFKHGTVENLPECFWYMKKNIKNS